MSRRRVRWGRVLGVAAALAVAGAAWLYGPDLLRDLEVFQVREVEVVGTRFTDPYDVVRAAGLSETSSLLDDGDDWAAGVRALPLVEAVRVRRVYPATVLLEVREVVPVALVAAGRLRPVDAGGRYLELDPAGAVLDLPVVSGLEKGTDAVADGPSRSAVATVAALSRTAPEVAERLSQAELRGDELRLSFRAGLGRAVIPAAATSKQLAQLRLTVADLRARGELAEVAMIDVRFRDQVVVSFLNRP